MVVGAGLVGQGSVGHTGLVVVSVTVVTEVVTSVVVDGLGACVVVGVALVVGSAVTVVVLGDGGGGGALEFDGSALLCSVGPLCDVGDVLPGADDVVAETLLDVPAGLSVVPEVVNLTTAYTSNASTAAVSTPNPTSTAGR